MQIGKSLLKDFEDEAANTRKMLAVVPEDRFEWKPHEKSMTLGQLASHLAEMPSWIDAMAQDEFDFGAMVAEYVPYSAKDRADLLATFEKNVEEVKTLLASWDDEFLAATWSMRNGDEQLLSGPRHSTIRSIAIHHAAHHRGQLSVYLRLLETRVPGTYGPTADDAALA